jgi:hypothetical protein
MAKVQHKRGLKANLPTTALNPGELLITTDRHTLHSSTDASTLIPLVPAIDDLTTIPAIDATNDLIMIHDVSENAAPKEKKMTFAAMKSALNIPASSTDEKVSVVSGGTSGYLYGTDGTNGILRVDTTLTMTKDSGNAFLTLSINSIDAGTF